MKATLDPKFASNALTQTADALLLWRQSVPGFKAHSVEGLVLQDGITYVDHCWLPDGHFMAAKSNREVCMPYAA